jgi:hypothetical protein
MQFRARLAQVVGAAPKDPDKPLTITVKLEPMLLEDPEWVFDRLGRYLLVELSDAPLPRTPIEDEIAKSLG